MSARTRSSPISISRASSSSNSTRKGTLAERIRAGGAGIPAFFTKTGVGTIVAEGKEIRDFNNEAYLMETGLVADISLVHAWMGDTEGNLVYRKTARNFNPMMATAGRLTIAEVEHLVQPGDIEADHIVTPGIFVHRIVHAPNAAEADRAAHHAQARGRVVSRRGDDALDPRPNGGARRQGAEGRLLRQPRHRHSDPGVELHPRGHPRSAAERERHARHGPLPFRGRRGSRTSSTPASRRSPNCRRPASSPAPIPSP